MLQCEVSQALFCILPIMTRIIIATCSQSACSKLRVKLQQNAVTVGGRLADVVPTLFQIDI